MESSPTRRARGFPGATATLVNEGTGAVSKQIADSAGEFGFDFLPVGSYTLRIESNGFKVQERKGIVLSAGQQVRQTFILEVGSVNETVSITGTAPLIDTVSAEQHQTFDTRAVSQLPLSRRNISNILGLENGVDVASGNRGVRINGAGKSGAGISVDGTDANSNPEGRGISQYGGENYIDVMSIEGVEEVQVVRGVLPAEYGGVMSGQVNLIYQVRLQYLAWQLRSRLSIPPVQCPQSVHSQPGGRRGHDVAQASHRLQSVRRLRRRPDHTRQAVCIRHV